VAVPFLPPVRPWLVGVCRLTARHFARVGAGLSNQSVKMARFNADPLAASRSRATAYRPNQSLPALHDPRRRG
jgi:hypothetical protein